MSDYYLGDSGSNPHLSHVSSAGDFWPVAHVQPNLFRRVVVRIQGRQEGQCKLLQVPNDPHELNQSAVFFDSETFVLTLKNASSWQKLRRPATAAQWRGPSTPCASVLLCLSSATGTEHRCKRRQSTPGPAGRRTHGGLQGEEGFQQIPTCNTVEESRPDVAWVSKTMLDFCLHY